MNQGRSVLPEERVRQLERACELSELQRNYLWLFTEGALRGSGLFLVHTKLPPSASQKGKEVTVEASTTKKKRAGCIRTKGLSSSHLIEEGKKF